MSDAKRLAEDIRTLRQKIKRGTAAAKNGESIDLSPFQSEVDSLCAAIGELPRDAARELQGELISMLEELSHLADVLRSGVEQIKRQLRELADGRRAASAYGNTR